MDAQVFVSPDVTEEMAHLWLADRRVAVQRYLADIPKEQWQDCLRVELQTFIEKTLRGSLSDYQIDRPKDVEAFLVAGAVAVLKQSYLILKTEKGIKSIWALYDRLNADDTLDVLLVAALADFVLNWSSVAATPANARKIHRVSSDFYDKEQEA